MLAQLVHLNATSVIKYEQQGCSWNQHHQVISLMSSVESCAEACLANVDCTSFEVSRLFVLGASYCALWLNKRCQRPDKSTVFVDTYTLLLRMFTKYEQASCLTSDFRQEVDYTKVPTSSDAWNSSDSLADPERCAETCFEQQESTNRSNSSNNCTAFTVSLTDKTTDKASAGMCELWFNNACTSAELANVSDVSDVSKRKVTTYVLELLSNISISSITSNSTQHLPTTTQSSLASLYADKVISVILCGFFLALCLVCLKSCFRKRHLKKKAKLAKVAKQHVA